MPVDGDTTILDIALRNLAVVGLTDVTVVVGYAAGAVERRCDPTWRPGYGVTGDAGAQRPRRGVEQRLLPLAGPEQPSPAGALLVNGDTVHPVSVEQTLLAGRGPEILLAVDDIKKLADEEMKTIFGDDGRLTRITKLMDPADAHGEYIGATLIEPQRPAGWPRRSRPPGGATPASTTRTATRSTPTAVARSARPPIGDVEWVEVDNHADLARAREIACHC